MKLFLINTVSSLALGWSAVLLYIALNFLRRRECPHFFCATGPHHSSSAPQKPWPLWLKIFLSPVYGTLLILLPWLLLVIVFPCFVVFKARRLAFASRR